MTKTIKTKADLKRLPIGTKLILTNTLLGSCHIPRTIKAIKSNRIVMELEDGRTSSLYLDTGTTVEHTASGFLLRCNETNRVQAEYSID